MEGDARRNNLLVEDVPLETPPVIDLTALLARIPGDRPAGAVLSRNSPELLELAALLPRPDLSTQDDANAAAAWSPDPLIERATAFLCHTSKDLWAAAWLVRAVTSKYGLAGLRDGLRLVDGLLDNYWEEVGPLPDEDGNLELRCAAIDYFCRGEEVRCWLSTAPVVQGFAKFRPMPHGEVDLTSELIHRILTNKRELEDALRQRHLEILFRLQCVAEEATAAAWSLYEITFQRFGAGEGPMPCYLDSTIFGYKETFSSLYQVQVDLSRKPWQADT